MNPLAPYLWLIKLAAAALLVVAIVFGVWLYGHRRYEAGIAAQRAAESKSLAIYTKARDAQLASAEASYHAEIATDQLHPLRLPVVRLCLDVPGSAVAGQVAARPARAAASSGSVQPLPSRDHPVRPDRGPDIAGMLAALARRADGVSAQARALIEAR